LVGIVGAGFLITTLADGVADSREARDKAVADSLFRAGTQSITQQQQQVLGEILNIRTQSDSLQNLQLQALVRMDSAALVSEHLSTLQRQTVRNLGEELALSRFMSDRLQANVALSRQIADSLRLAEARAAERSQQTLSTVERRSNPLTSLSSNLHLYFSRRDTRSAEILDALYTRVAADHRLTPTFPRNAPFQLRDKTYLQVLPTHAFLYFWRGEDCETSFNFNEVIVSAVRELHYDRVQSEFEIDSASGLVQGLRLEWNSVPFEIRTLQNVTVDDLGGACLLVELGPRYMMTWPELSVGWWDEVDVSITTIDFPQGRFANIWRGERRIGRQTHYMKLWDNVPYLPTQLEMVDTRQPQE
jgi:hypothetical protein